MGKVYDFLEFLNAGVIPNSSTRPTSPLLQVILDVSRDTVSKTGFGDLVLWMLDHGVVLRERGDVDTDTQSTSINIEKCSGAGQSIRTTDIISSDNYISGPYRSFRSDSLREVINAGTDSGQYTKVHSTNFVRESPSGVKSASTSFSVTYTWTRHTGPTWVVSSKSTGNHPTYHFIAPGYVNGDDILSDLDIPIDTIFGNSCWGTNDSYSLCSGNFTYPALLEMKPRGTCNIIPDTLVPESPPAPPLYGYVTYIEYGPYIYYPAFSSAENLSKSEATEFLQSLTLSKFAIPVSTISSDPVARALFGDIEPPLWYNS